MGKDRRDDNNWTDRKRWSPRNLGTYGFGSDSNDWTDLPPAEVEAEPRERWHNREFYEGGAREGYMSLGARSMMEFNGVRQGDVQQGGPHHHVSPRYHSKWERSLHGDEQYSTRHGWRMPFENLARPTAGQHQGKGPKNYQRSDERVFEEVCERLTYDGELDASGVEVNVENGEVTLRGTVESRQMKHRAEDLLEGVFGVRDIRNELKVAKS